jgi:hypothetical protein
LLTIAGFTATDPPPETLAPPPEVLFVVEGRTEEAADPGAPIPDTPPTPRTGATSTVSLRGGLLVEGGEGLGILVFGRGDLEGGLRGPEEVGWTIGGERGRLERRTPADMTP